jgi:RNA polymerase primary sigma factor
MAKDPIDAENRHDLDPLSESDEVALDDESEQEDVFRAREQHETVARNAGQDDADALVKPSSPDVSFQADEDLDEKSNDGGDHPTSSDEVETDDPISLYLREMARVPLLTPDQEVSLAKSMERGRLAQEYLKKNGCTPAEHRGTYKQIEAGKMARAHLIRANTRLVVSVAKRYRGNGVPFLDLIQEGNMGLMRAADKFDYSLGHKFSTYATWWIRQAITRALSDQGRTIRLPVHMGDRIRRVHRVAQQLEQQFGQKPTPEEIAEEMNLDAHKVRWMLRVSYRPYSLEKPVGEDEENELGSFIEDKGTLSPSDVATQNMLKERMDELLNTLTPREARILRLRFGLDNGRAYTLEEIGRKFGLTRERIRQIQMEALRKLRHPSRSRRLKGYLS